MGTFSSLLANCAGNSPVTGEFPAQRPVTRGFDVLFELCLNKRLRKQLWGWWFETASRSLWRHSNGCLLSLHASFYIGTFKDYCVKPVINVVFPNSIFVTSKRHSQMPFLERKSSRFEANFAELKGKNIYLLEYAYGNVMSNVGNYNKHWIRYKSTLISDRLDHFFFFVDEIKFLFLAK